MKYKITKNLGEYPFAHRQHNHNGHCALIHGHNWGFIVELGADELDENGFVYDFGKFKQFKDFLTEHFDHTLVLSETDPLLVAQGGSKASETFLQTIRRFSKVIVVPSCSCEGIAKFVFDHLFAEFGYVDRVFVLSVTVTEDSKNSATYSGE